MSDFEQEERKWWDEYLVECQITGTRPDLSDFSVWLSDRGIELDG